MAKEINRVSFEIEHYNGQTYFGFMLSIKDDGSVEVIKTNECSHADTDGDYIFDTENDLYRIQADKPISEEIYDEIWACYEEHEIKTENIEKRIQEMLIREAEENECTVEEVKQILIEDWGKGGDRGYGIFTSDFPELEHIERIDVLGVYDEDLEAGKQAEKDGIKLIPLEENTKEYPYDCYRFIDTEENRKILEEIKNTKH